jgi:hypothetical protein
MDAKFEVGDELLDYPGDPSGSAATTINCFDGDTALSFDSCKKSIRSVYNGELITVETSRGHKITGTPNHPVLTDSGFIRLDEVNHSTNLLCCNLNKRITGDLDIDNVPSTFKKVHDALSVVGDSVRVPAVTVDLYGRKIINSNINVVGVESFLRGADVAEFFKLFDKLALKDTNFGKGSFLGNRLLDRKLFMERFRLVSDRLISFGDLIGSLLVGHFRPFKHLGFGLAAPFNASLFKQSGNDTTIHAKMQRGGVFAFARDIHGDSRVAVKDGSRSARDISLAQNFISVGLTDAKMGADVSDRLSANVHIDNATLIKRFEVNAHNVYTIETEEGLYNAGGIIARNCRCVVGYDVVSSDDVVTPD